MVTQYVCECGCEHFEYTIKGVKIATCKAVGPVLLRLNKNELNLKPFFYCVACGRTAEAK